MKVFHIELAKIGLGLSGGEKCMVEIIKYFASKNIKNVILTTDNGRSCYEELGIKESKYITYIVINTFWSEKRFHVFFSYIIRLFYFIKIKKEVIGIIDSKKDILMCHSDFFPNTLAANALGKFFYKKTFYWFHMLAPDIFKGYKGHFTGKMQLPRLNVIHYKLNQYLFHCIARKSYIITVNKYYNDLFGKNNKYTTKHVSGREVYTIKKYSGLEVNVQETNVVKDYDLAFMGRFHDQKGLFEIPRILSLLKQNNPNIKLLLIGGGNKKNQDRFFAVIEELGLTKNIEYVGYISTDEKFRYLQRAKIFIFPSYYESFGQVVLEAMANGLPVIAYDLPVFSVFEKGIIRVPILNNVKFAQEIEAFLSDPNKLVSFSREASEYASTFSWAKTGEEVYNLIINI